MEHTFFQVSLHWHVQLVTPQVLLICLMCGNCLCADSPRHKLAMLTEEKLMSSNSTSAQPTTNKKKPTTTTATDTNTATNTTTTASINNQQQMHSHENSNNCSIKLLPRTHLLQHSLHRACAQKTVKGNRNNSCKKKQRHMASNSMENPSQRQVTQGPQSPLSGLDGPTITAILSASCSELLPQISTTTRTTTLTVRTACTPP